jgi:hypothetical protein
MISHGFETPPLSLSVISRSQTLTRSLYAITASSHNGTLPPMKDRNVHAEPHTRVGKLTEDVIVLIFLCNEGLRLRFLRCWPLLCGECIEDWGKQISTHLSRRLEITVSSKVSIQIHKQDQWIMNLCLNTIIITFAFAFAFVLFVYVCDR